MKEKKQSAFPSLHLDGYRGMSLRDYFAAKAMQGVMSTYHHDKALEDIALERIQIAEMSYAIADAMLKQRKL